MAAIATERTVHTHPSVTTMVNLSEFPDEIIAEIVNRLPLLEDTLRFGAVCKSWNSLVNHQKIRRKRFGPWLMLAKLENDDLTSNQGIFRSVYNLFSRKAFNLELPLLRGRRCWGTPYGGWLFTVGLDKTIFLYNPFTQAKIYFPSHPHCEYADHQHISQVFISRAAFSSDPPHSSTVAMVIYGGGFDIAVASPADKAWTHIETQWAVEDVVFFKGNFYCIDRKGILWICDINGPHPTAQPIASAPTELTVADTPKFYLVEISGCLYFINRIQIDSDEGELSPGDGHCDAKWFAAYVFDFHSKQWSGKVAEDLHGHALLLGNNTTCAVSALDYPELRPGCIYFTDDTAYLYDRESGYYYDMGVYDFKNKTMLEPFYQVHQVASQFSRPFFLFPSLA